MPIRHEPTAGDYVVTTVSRPVNLAAGLDEIEKLARRVQGKEPWRQLVRIERGVMAELEYADMLAVADWLGAACEHFARTQIAFVANSEPERMWLNRMCDLLSEEGIEAEVFETQEDGAAWLGAGVPASRVTVLLRE